MEVCEGQFAGKVDKTEFEEQLATRIPNSEFYKVFPKEVPPQDTFKMMVRIHSEALTKRVIEMVKLWDQKIVNLRSELNI